MMLAAEGVNAHRHLIRWSPFFELHDGRTMARRSDVVGQRVSSMTMLDRRNKQLPK
jgi:hypothetical protein